MRKNKLFLAVAVSFITALVALAPSINVFAATNQRMAIPLYAYPGGTFWNNVTSSAGQIPFVAANPDSGPGTTRNNDYVNQIKTTVNAGTRVIGYIAISYNTRPMADIKAEIDRWYNLYPWISGIFIDEFAATDEHVCDQAEIFNYIKSKQTISPTIGLPVAITQLVVSNPGVHIDSAAILPYSDIFATFENYASVYTGSYPAPTLAFETDPANSNRIMHIIHSSNNTMYPTILADTANRNAGWVYITNDVMPNPYDAIPNNFTTMLGDLTATPATTFPNLPATPAPATCSTNGGGNNNDNNGNNNNSNNNQSNTTGVGSNSIVPGAPNTGRL